MTTSFREYLASIDEETTSGDIASVDSVVGASAKTKIPKYRRQINKDTKNVTDQACSEDSELQETQLD